RCISCFRGRPVNCESRLRIYPSCRGRLRSLPDHFARRECGGRPRKRKWRTRKQSARAQQQSKVLTSKCAPGADRWPFFAELILAHKKRCTDGLERFGAGGAKRLRGGGDLNGRQSSGESRPDRR